MTTQDTKSEADFPFFIFGCGRSGTSLLSRMLNHHSRIAVPYESHLFNTFFSQLKYYGDLSVKENQQRLVKDILKTDVMQDWDPRLGCDTVLSHLKSNDFKGIFSAIMDAWAVATGKSRWGEKTPHHVDYWNTLSQYYPEARIIHIYRDGRDVALSLKRARFGPKTYYSAAKYWQNYLSRVQRVKATVPPSHFLELSYEELLNNSENTLKRVCDFVHESYEPSMLEFHQTKAIYNTDPQNRANLHKPILKGNQQKWKKEMSPRSIRMFESIAGNELKALGYPIEQPQPAPLSLPIHIYEKLKAITLKAVARFKNFKGIRDGFIRMCILVRIRLMRKKA